MRTIRLKVESLEDRTMPSALGAIPPNIVQNLQEDFAAMVPVMQQQLQGEVNVAANLVKTLPPSYQILATQLLTEAQAVVNAFPVIAWNWLALQLGQDAGVSPSLLLLPQVPSTTVGTQPPTGGGSAHPQSGLSRVWTFAGTALDTSIWAIDTAINSGNILNLNQNYSAPSHIVVNNGYLQILLTQQQGMVGSNPQGVISTGGMIHTKETFGYGTYEFCARMGSTATSPLATGNSASGSHSALFNYINDSETEIDMEAYGSWPNHIDATTWKNPNPSQDVASADSSETYFQDPGMGAGFQVYKFVWTPNTITFYVNNQYQATLNNFIGSAPANLFVALFGSDSSTNSASLGVNQYMYVQWIRYTAPGDTPLPVPT